MRYLTLRPLLGTKNNCPIDSPNMFKVLGENDIITHDAGGQNFDLDREKDSCSKAFGRAAWSSAANASATKCLGLHELWDGTNRAHFYFDNGKVYQFDPTDRDQDDVSNSLTFALADTDLYSIIQYGTYMVFADHGTTKPYKIDHDDGAVSALITSGTDFVFRYLMNFTNRIIGLYSGETNGDIDIRWTEPLVGTTFPAANQLYKSGDSIQGGIQLGHNTAFVYGDNDIYRMDYYASATPCFTLIPVMPGWGTGAPFSLITDGIAIYAYDPQRGFSRFDGVNEPQVISDDYEGMVSRIPYTYHNLIDSVWIPWSGEIAWNIPVDNDVTPSKIIFYNRKTKQWRHENKAARRLDAWRTFTGITWNNLRVETDDIWPSASTWAYYTSESHKLVFGNSNGHLYSQSSEGDDTANWDGYRIEPIIPFPEHGKKFTRLAEVWIDIAETQAHSIDFYWRGGDTIAETKTQAWASLGSISMNDPTNAVIYPDISAKNHQIKWGTDLKSEPFSIPALRLGYVTQGSY